MKYYLAENEQPVGPFEVGELVSRGLKGTDLVWAEGFEGWVPAETVEEIRVAMYGPSDPQSACRASAIPEMPATPRQGQCPPPPVRPLNGNSWQQQSPVQEVMPKTWLVESRVVNLLCFLPLGIVGIIKASNVTSLWAAGQAGAAREASAAAKRWSLIGLICGLVVSVLYILFVVFAGVSGALGNL